MSSTIIFFIVKLIKCYGFYKYIWVRGSDNIMFEDVLPNYIVVALNNLNLSKINEIRLRNNKRILINVNGSYFYLTNLGVSKNDNGAIICEKGVIEKQIEWHKKEISSLQNKIDTIYCD